MKLILSCLTIFILSNELSAQYFKVRDGVLYDANNQEFVMRGINSAQMEWDYMNWDASGKPYYMNLAFNSIKTISETGANTIRMLWRKDNGPGQSYNLPGMDTNKFEQTIQEAIKWKLVPIVELHDVTGSSDVSALQKCAEWWAKMVPMLKKYEKYVIINIANEWGGWDIASNNKIWRDAYISAVKTIRNAGWKATIMVDAPTWGQNPGGILEYGKDVLNSDPEKNVMFSIHFYGEKNQKTKEGFNWSDYNQLFWNIKFVQKLCVIAGEFGMVDYNELMRQAFEKKVGYLPWSWHGNGKDAANLNMCAGDPWSDKGSWTRGVFSKFGNDIINSSYGIRQTSKKASIF